MPLILGANQLTAGGYEIDNSLRFNDDSSDYLNKTFGSAGNRKTWTFSAWIKRSNLITSRIFCTVASGVDDYIKFDTSHRIEWGFDHEDATNRGKLITNRVFRDVSAWYHIVCAVDTTNATAGNRMRIYINGVEETSFATDTNPTQNEDGEILNANPHFLSSTSSAQFYDGYMADVYMIGGQQLTPTSFGEFDSDTNIWKPIPYTGSFGTNGFYLEFQNSGALGTDSSGNGNTFTVNNLTSIDQTTDTPTNNFATMNPLTSFGTVTLAEGNLQVGVPDNTANSTSTFMVSSGKWYWEVKQTVGTLAMVGIRPANTAYGNTFGVGDIIGVALDLDNNKLYFSKNGTFQNSGVPTSGATGTGAVSIATSGLTWGFSFTSGGNIDTIQCNFGNPPFTISSGNADADGFGNFEYAVPSGYYSLCTKNLAEYA